MARKKKKDARLERIQLLVLKGQWELSSHVLDYIQDGEFELRDVEGAILTGSITESQKDEVEVAVDGRKYTILGSDHCGLPFETVGKIVEGAKGNEYFVITAYQRR